MLAYLAVESDQAHPRNVLAGLLWPHRPHSDALANLRYTLYNLRNVLKDREVEPPFLTITHRALQFNTGSDHHLDVTAFERHIAESQSPNQQGGVPNPTPSGAQRNAPDPHGILSSHQPSSSKETARHLQSAIDLYRGPFLEGLSPTDCPDVEAWMLLKQERVAQQMMSALQRMVQLHTARGEYQRAISYAQRLLSLEPWDEQGHRQLMRLLALSGRRSAAISQYKTCRRLLAEELGVEPTDETTALFEQIRQGHSNRGPIRTGASPRRPSPDLPSPSRPEPCVGRERELEKLSCQLRRSLAGQGRVVLVSGDAGSGKTVLIGEFVRRAMAAHGDLLVASGTCSTQAGIGDPYLPFREILQMLTGDVEARRASGTVQPEHARRLWALFPKAVEVLLNEGPGLVGRFLPAEALALRVEAFGSGNATWRARLTSLAERRKTASAAADKTALFEQLTRVLRALARQHPLILVLDDLQWADAGTVSLLFHLGRHLRDRPILLVGAYRPAEVAMGRDGRRHPLAAVLHEVQRAFGDVQIDLNQADGRHFVDAFLEAEPTRLGPAFRQTLYRHTDGNPLFTIELLRGLQERGDLERDGEGRWVVGPELDWGRLPARVEGTIAERLARLSPPCREFLTVASVEGESFTAEVVARVQGLDEGLVIQQLSGPLRVRHHLVAADSVRRLDGRKLCRYRFRHVLFQQYLYRSIDAVERVRLHEAVGRALEALCGQEAEALSTALARHFEAARMTSKAVDYLLQAGLEAARLSADEEAVALFRRGLELLETEPPTPARDRRELSLRSALRGPLRATGGPACPELARSKARERELRSRLDEPPGWQSNQAIVY